MEIGSYYEVMNKAFETHYLEGSDVWSKDNEMRCLPSLIKGILKLPKSTQVLDIGCGSGDDVDYFADIFQYVVGIDLYEHKAWKPLSEKRENLEFTQSNFLSFATNRSFDLVIDNGCFHHQHPQKYLEYLNKVNQLLNEEGFFVLSTFKNENIDLLKDRLGRLHMYFEDDALHTLLKESGFQVHTEFDIYRKRKGDYYRLSFCNKSMSKFGF